MDSNYTGLMNELRVIPRLAWHTNVVHEILLDWLDENNCTLLHKVHLAFRWACKGNRKEWSFTWVSEHQGRLYNWTFHPGQGLYKVAWAGCEITLNLTPEIPDHFWVSTGQPISSECEILRWLDRTLERFLDKVLSSRGLKTAPNRRFVYAL